MNTDNNPTTKDNRTVNTEFKTPSSLSAPVPLLTITSHSPETTPKRRTRGRLSNAEQLAKSQNNSKYSLPELFRNFSNKRERELDIVSPPNKLLKPDSPPPPTHTADDSSHVSNTLDLTAMNTDTNACNSFPELLQQMQAWRQEDRIYLSKMMAELNTNIEAVKTSNLLLIQEVKAEIAAETSALKKEITSIETRLSAIENQPHGLKPTSSPVNSTLNRNLANSAIAAVEKHMRRNNIIISGLETNTGKALETVKEFISTHFNLPDCIDNATVIGKTRKRIKATFKDNNSKSLVMSKKKSIAIPVYINHDLTPEEEIASKKIRDFGKQAIAEHKKVKFGHLFVSIDGTVYKYNTESKSIKPCNITNAGKPVSNAQNLTGASNAQSKTIAPSAPIRTKNHLAHTMDSTPL